MRHEQQPSAAAAPSATLTSPNTRSRTNRTNPTTTATAAVASGASSSSVSTSQKKKNQILLGLILLMVLLILHESLKGRQAQYIDPAPTRTSTTADEQGITQPPPPSITRRKKRTLPPEHNDNHQLQLTSAPRRQEGENAANVVASQQQRREDSDEGNAIPKQPSSGGDLAAENDYALYACKNSCFKRPHSPLTRPPAAGDGDGHQEAKEIETAADVDTTSKNDGVEAKQNGGPQRELLQLDNEDHQDAVVHAVGAESGGAGGDGQDHKVVAHEIVNNDKDKGDESTHHVDGALHENQHEQQQHQVDLVHQHGADSNQHPEHENAQNGGGEENRPVGNGDGQNMPGDDEAEQKRKAEAEQRQQKRLEKCFKACEAELRDPELQHAFLDMYHREPERLRQEQEEAARQRRAKEDGRGRDPHPRHDDDDDGWSKNKKKNMVKKKKSVHDQMDDAAHRSIKKEQDAAEVGSASVGHKQRLNRLRQRAKGEENHQQD